MWLIMPIIRIQRRRLFEGFAGLLVLAEHEKILPGKLKRSGILRRGCLKYRRRLLIFSALVKIICPSPLRHKLTVHKKATR